MTMTRKGILLAGGRGTRLAPATDVVSKQLLPVYDKPMVYYPLAVLMQAGIREVLVISTRRDLPLYGDLLGDGSRFGMTFAYAVQEAPRGLAEALVIGADFLAGGPSLLVLGDNVLCGDGLPGLLRACDAERAGATILAAPVADPERYAVAEFDAQGRVLSLEEKPARPRSRHAVPGVYFYDSRAVGIARGLTPSPRGELEITDLNRAYLDCGALNLRTLPADVTWFDAGTEDSLVDAAVAIRDAQRRRGRPIACIEEIAWRQGWIGRQAVDAAARRMGGSAYGRHLALLTAEAAA